MSQNINTNKTELQTEIQKRRHSFLDRLRNTYKQMRIFDQVPKMVHDYMIPYSRLKNQSALTRSIVLSLVAMTASTTALADVTPVPTPIPDSSSESAVVTPSILDNAMQGQTHELKMVLRALNESIPQHKSLVKFLYVNDAAHPGAPNSMNPLQFTQFDIQHLVELFHHTDVKSVITIGAVGGTLGAGVGWIASRLLHARANPIMLIGGAIGAVAFGTAGDKAGHLINDQRMAQELNAINPHPVYPDDQHLTVNMIEVFQGDAMNQWLYPKDSVQQNKDKLPADRTQQMTAMFHQVCVNANVYLGNSVNYAQQTNNFSHDSNMNHFDADRKAIDQSVQKVQQSEKLYVKSRSIMMGFMNEMANKYIIPQALLQNVLQVSTGISTPDKYKYIDPYTKSPDTFNAQGAAIAVQKDDHHSVTTVFDSHLGDSAKQQEQLVASTTQRIKL